MSYIIVGLGNPDEEYAGTRHNAGRMLVQAVHKAYHFGDWKHDKKLNALVAKGEIEQDKVSLILPETFMNRSGSALAPVVTTEKKAEKLVVIYDDLDLPMGSIKMSFNRGSGGHKGIESIAKSIKTKKFIRIRVGIAPTTPSGKLKKPSDEHGVQKHILGEFKKAELDILNKEGKEVVKVLSTLVTGGLQQAMTELNTGK
jgi:PTH1 family peptidyl-tRNA hydrolase